jgi:hypothetical protein
MKSINTPENEVSEQTRNKKKKEKMKRKRR